DAMPALRRDKNLDWAALLDGALAGEAARIFPRHPFEDRVVRATIGPMRRPGGPILGALLTFEDITHNAREEERRRVQTRSDAVEALGAGIAHEIRNPLNA